MRILFMGTPEIAAVMLREIAKENEICGVFCQPDKPVGRKAIITPPAVKTTALELGIPVFQPQKLRDGEAAKTVWELAPELIAVVAYGRILPKEILDIPRFGCVNIHASLLPKYRGSAPMQHALLDGVRTTGVSAMFMDEGMDTGDIIEQRVIELSEDDDAEKLFERSGVLGASLLCDTVRAIAAGTAKRTPQDNAVATMAPMLTKEQGLFCFEDDAHEIACKVRGLSIWPNAYFEHAGKKIKVLKAHESDRSGAPGEVLGRSPLCIAAKNGSIELVEVKPEGSRAMSGSEWSAGLRLHEGDLLK